MKKKLLWIVSSIFLLVGCNGESSNGSEVVSDQKDNSTLVESSDTQEKSVYQKLVEKKYSFYKINNDYQIKYNGSQVAYGSESKSVYIGKDSQGLDSKVEFLVGYITNLGSLSDNSDSESSEFTYYHSPSKTYEKLSDGTYKVTNEEHTIAPYSMPLDFSLLSDVKESTESGSYYVNGAVEESKVVSFFGSLIKDTSDIKDVKVKVNLTIDADINEVSLNYLKKEYSITQTFTFSDINSIIELPTVK